MRAAVRCLGPVPPLLLPATSSACATSAARYVGEEDATLDNLCVLLSQSDAFIYAPPPPPPPPGEACGEPGGEPAEAAPVRRLQLATAKRLMRRYFLVQQAREAAVVGLLVGSLSASHRQPLLQGLKALCQAKGRKCGAAARPTVLAPPDLGPPALPGATSSSWESSTPQSSQTSPR